jgi:hypothetical protein
MRCRFFFCLCLCHSFSFRGRDISVFIPSYKEYYLKNNISDEEADRLKNEKIKIAADKISKKISGELNGMHHSKTTQEKRNSISPRNIAFYERKYPELSHIFLHLSIFRNLWILPRIHLHKPGEFGTMRKDKEGRVATWQSSISNTALWAPAKPLRP